MKNILVFLLIIYHSNVSASLIEGSWVNGMPNNTDLTFDTETGLEWLDTNKLAGLSVNAVNGLLNTTTYSGFRYASVDELATIISHANLSPHGICFFCTDVTEVENFLGLCRGDI